METETKPEAKPEEVVEEFLINKELLQLVLKKEIEKFEISSGSNAGDNYMSIIHAIEVKVKEEEKPRHILIKCYPNSVGRREFLDFTDVFGKEFFFYNEWAPILAELANGSKSGISVEKLGIPEFLGGNYKGTKDKKSDYPEPWSKENFLVMTDLRKTFGFKMANREEGLDYQHTLLALKELAKFHALSWCYKKQKGVDKLISVYPQMKDTMYEDNNVMEEQFKELMASIQKSTLSYVEEAVGPDSPTYSGTKKMFALDQMGLMRAYINPNGVDEEHVNGLLRISNDPPSTEKWLVGCHGDYWVNNMLFRYNDQKNPVETIALDLQMYREACPTTDLAYFFYSSTTAALRKAHMDEFLKTYYDVFTQICHKLDYEPLPGWSLNNLKRKFRRSKILGFCLSVTLLSVVLKPAEEAVELDTIVGDISEIFSNVMAGGDKNARLKARLVEIAVELYEDGVI